MQARTESNIVCSCSANNHSEHLSLNGLDIFLPVLLISKWTLQGTALMCFEVSEGVQNTKILFPGAPVVPRPLPFNSFGLQVDCMILNLCLQEFQVTKQVKPVLGFSVTLTKTSVSSSNSKQALPALTFRDLSVTLSGVVKTTKSSSPGSTKTFQGLKSTTVAKKVW